MKKKKFHNKYFYINPLISFFVKFCVDIVKCRNEDEEWHQQMFSEEKHQNIFQRESEQNVHNPDF